MHYFCNIDDVHQILKKKKINPEICYKKSRRGFTAMMLPLLLNLKLHDKNGAGRYCTLYLDQDTGPGKYP